MTSITFLVPNLSQVHFAPVWYPSRLLLQPSISYRCSNHSCPKKASTSSRSKRLEAFKIDQITSTSNKLNEPSSATVNYSRQLILIHPNLPCPPQFNTINPQNKGIFSMLTVATASTHSLPQEPTLLFQCRSSDTTLAPTEASLLHPTCFTTTAVLLLPEAQFFHLIACTAAAVLSPLLLQELRFSTQLTFTAAEVLSLLLPQDPSSTSNLLIGYLESKLKNKLISTWTAWQICISFTLYDLFVSANS